MAPFFIALNVTNVLHKIQNYLGYYKTMEDAKEARRVAEEVFFKDLIAVSKDEMDNETFKKACKKASLEVRDYMKKVKT